MYTDLNGTGDLRKMNWGMEPPYERWFRKQLNGVAIFLALFIPWALFSVMFWVASFSLHYRHQITCYTIIGCGLAFVLVIGLYAQEALQMRERRDPDREPTWILFLFVFSLLAWAAGVIAGDANYKYYMEPFYDTTSLSSYAAVDASVMTGQQLMDAGRIIFMPGTKLDVSRSSGFKNSEVYCVAPIVTGSNAKPLPNYDFWAVGTNCCTGTVPDFQCGEYQNPNANAGLRLMRDDEAPFYRMAVEQAEASFKIKSRHPLFFQWVKDPIAEINSYLDNGVKYFLLGICAYFLLQFFLVLVAACTFVKMIRPMKSLPMGT